MPLTPAVPLLQLGWKKTVPQRGPHTRTSWLLSVTLQRHTSSQPFRNTGGTGGLLGPGGSGMLSRYSSRASDSEAGGAGAAPCGGTGGGAGSGVEVESRQEDSGDVGELCMTSSR